MRKVLTLLFLMPGVALLGPAAGCSSSSPGAHGRIPVVAAENFWGDVARQIGGSYVDVTSIIKDPSADPHLYESDARDAQAIADARLVIVNGVGYDDFMGKLLGSTSGNRTVLTAAELAPKVADGANPHLWYDLGRVRSMATAIEQAFARLRPAHANDFAANRARFDAALQPIDSVIATIKSRFPTRRWRIRSGCPATCWRRPGSTS